MKDEEGCEQKATGARRRQQLIRVRRSLEGFEKLGAARAGDRKSIVSRGYGHTNVIEAPPFWLLCTSRPSPVLVVFASPPSRKKKVAQGISAVRLEIRENMEKESARIENKTRRRKRKIGNRKWRAATKPARARCLCLLTSCLSPVYLSEV